MTRAAAIAMTLAVILPPGAGLAQAPKVDPTIVSGNWGTFGIPLLELRSDERGAVSGTVHFRFGPPVSAPIATGRFDPVERTLRLEGRVDAETPYVIEASLEGGDTLQATYEVGGRKGTQTLTRLTSEGPDGR
jgi:hypothetical protein